MPKCDSRFDTGAATIAAANRLLWPIAHAVMYPPYDLPAITSLLLAMPSAWRASITAMNCGKSSSPQCPFRRSANLRPKLVEPTACGTTTAHPCEQSVFQYVFHGKPRSAKAFGPPCASTSSGCGPFEPFARTSQPTILSSPPAPSGTRKERNSACSGVRSHHHALSDDSCSSLLEPMARAKSSRGLSAASEK
ncbi:MAG TPA: hypothetical protein VM122_03125 [Usitatibacter sp.]|nr:hypothetical protein [Usitatibacter sp.]